MSTSARLISVAQNNVINANLNSCKRMLDDADRPLEAPSRINIEEENELHAKSKECVTGFDLVYDVKCLRQGCPTRSIKLNGKMHPA